MRGSGLPRLPKGRAIPAALGVLALVALGSARTSASEEPKGIPFTDPELAALFRPSDGVVEEGLTRASDGHVHYWARLKHLALPGFSERYLEELERRGVEVHTVFSSSHAASERRVIGYDFVAWQEAALDPYTVRFREGEERDYGRRPAHPVSVNLDRLTIRSPAEFAGAWRGAVIIPREHAQLPYPIPLPADAVVRTVQQERYLELADHEWKPTSIRSLTFQVIFRSSVVDIADFYRRALQDCAEIVVEEGGQIAWRFRSIPDWAPPLSDTFALMPEATLFATPRGKSLPDADHAGATQRAYLPHLPRDVRRYSLAISLKKEAQK